MTPESRSDTNRFPRWVVLAGIVLAIVVLVAISVMLLGGGQGVGHVRPAH
jgi:hypothetical protein